MSTCTPTRLLQRMALGAVLLGPAAAAQAVNEVPEGELTLAEVTSVLRAQASELAAAQALIASQQGQLDQQAQELARQREQLDTQRQALQLMQARADTQPGGTRELSPYELELRARLETLESQLARQPEDPTQAGAGDRLPGAIPLPGTSASLRIGGFVKANVVQSFEATGIQDRFIVGTIPTDPDVRGDAQAALTARQSRLNFELRETTGVGPLRAFIEGDFAGEGDTFRLRHAFGQFRDALAGKTWSTFMDTDASPEEVDFEGINGRINSRRTQIRWFPAIGEEWNLAVALEDPQTSITGGDGLSQIPDVVMAAKRTIRGLFTEREWHLRTALMLRNIRARWEVDPSRKESATGWGFSLSGRTSYKRWDERDNFMFQLNYGKGYASYVNDLATVGGQDGVFDAETGEFAALPAFSWYGAFQHWWDEALRSTFIVSRVNISNKDFQTDDAYESTWRLSGNLIWSPTPRVDIGGELLWGQREDQDGAKGNASQVQVTAKYRF